MKKADNIKYINAGVHNDDIVALNEGVFILYNIKYYYSIQCSLVYYILLRTILAVGYLTKMICVNCQGCKYLSV